jgi:hypothetical protein
MPQIDALGTQKIQVEQSHTDVGANEPVRITVRSRDVAGFTPAGFAAVLNQVKTYLTAAKLAELQRRVNVIPSVMIGPFSVAYSVLPVDAAAQSALLNTILQVSVNVG